MMACHLFDFLLLFWISCRYDATISHWNCCFGSNCSLNSRSFGKRHWNATERSNATPNQSVMLNCFAKEPRHLIANWSWDALPDETGAESPGVM